MARPFLSEVTWERIKRTSAVLSLGNFAMSLYSKIENWPIFFMWCFFAAGLGFGLFAVLVAWGLIPWKPKNVPPQVATNPEDEFRKIAIHWICHRDIARHTLDELYDRLRDIPEWASTAELSCRLFAHATFTLDTYERLANWLKHSLGTTKDESFLVLPRSEVVRMLQEVVDKKR